MHIFNSKVIISQTYCNWFQDSSISCHERRVLLQITTSWQLTGIFWKFLKRSTGSVNGGNSAELAKKEDIDGFLVGGASLKVLLQFLFFVYISFRSLCESRLFYDDVGSRVRYYYQLRDFQEGGCMIFGSTPEMAQRINCRRRILQLNQGAISFGGRLLLCYPP